LSVNTKLRRNRVVARTSTVAVASLTGM